MDWLVHLFTNADFLNFILLLALFGGFAFLGRGIKWLVKFISGHILRQKELDLQIEKARGENLDKQLEILRRQQQPKMPNVITPDDLMHENYTYESGYPAQSQEQ